MAREFGVKFVRSKEGYIIAEDVYDSKTGKFLYRKHHPHHIVALQKDMDIDNTIKMILGVRR